jgi:hypothetical protein
MCHQATKPENMNPQKVFALFSLAGFVSLMVFDGVQTGLVKNEKKCRR